MSKFRSITLFHITSFVCQRFGNSVSSPDSTLFEDSHQVKDSTGHLFQISFCNIESSKLLRGSSFRSLRINCCVYNTVQTIESKSNSLFLCNWERHTDIAFCCRPLLLWIYSHKSALDPLEGLVWQKRQHVVCYPLLPPLNTDLVSSNDSAQWENGQVMHIYLLSHPYTLLVSVTSYLCLLLFISTFWKNYAQQDFMLLLSPYLKLRLL